VSDRTKPETELLRRYMRIISAFNFQSIESKVYLDAWVAYTYQSCWKLKLLMILWVSDVECSLDKEDMMNMHGWFDSVLMAGE